MNKIFLLASIVLTGMFASCSDDDYTPGQPAGPNSKYNVVFSSEDAGNVALELTATEFECTLTRDSALDQQLVVPIKALQVPSFMKVPEEVVFEKDASTAVLKVEVDTASMPVFKDYGFVLALPEEYSNPYKPEGGVSRLDITVVREDFKPYKQAIFGDMFWSKEEYPVMVEYSELKKVYRINSFMGVLGNHLYFKWDGKLVDCEEFYVSNLDGDNLTGIGTPTGLDYPGYGAIVAVWTGADAYDYDEEEGATFYLQFSWDIPSAGASFGKYTEYFYFPE